MSKNVEIELIRLRMSVEAIRDRVTRDLAAVAAEIERLLPEQRPDYSKVPTTKELLELAMKKGGKK